MTSDLDRQFRSRDFVRVRYARFDRYEKRLPDRTIYGFVFKGEEHSLDRVFISGLASVSRFASLHELELAITYQELRPLQFLTRPLPVARLDVLERAGYVTRTAGQDQPAERGGRRRTYYALTERGRRTLRYLPPNEQR